MYWELTPATDNAPINLVETIQRHPRWGEPDYTFRDRPLAGIDTILVHHAASTTAATPADVARWHVEGNGWPGPGYHLIIDWAGVACKVNLDRWATYHAFSDNWSSFGICLIGNLELGPASFAQLVTLHREVQRYRSYAAIRYLGGHQEGKDRRNRGTSCPGHHLLPVVEELRERFGLAAPPREENQS